MTSEASFASVRYIVDDVAAATAFYRGHFGFEVMLDAPPAFAELRRGPLRLLISGPASSGSRITPPEFAAPGRNRIHLVVDSLAAEVERLRREGVTPLTETFAGPGGRQVLVADPAGNLLELFEPAARP